MHFDNAHRASHMIADLAHDVWQARSRLVPSSDISFDTNPPKILLSYRVSISDMEPVSRDEADFVDDCIRDVNFYFHFVVSRDRWWFTVSDQSDFQVDHADLVFRETDEDRDWDVRCESWRQYAFSDLVQPMIEKKIETVQSDMVKPGNPYLWGTMPLTDFRPRVTEQAA